MNHQVIELDELDPQQWHDYAEQQGWGDGLPTIPPTEQAVAAFLAQTSVEDVEIGDIPPRRVAPTPETLAANAIMAGCQPEHFPLLLAALTACLEPVFNLHGVLATTHPCTPALLVNGPARSELGINSATNCLGQGTRANAALGRALHLVLTNVGGATPGTMDRATQGAPSKFTLCFGENEEENPWEPYHVRRGFASTDTVATVAATEPPHNINDHGSNTGDEILTTVANTIAEAGSNNVYVRGPHFLVLGPEHAATLARDQWTITQIQNEIYTRSRIHMSRISPGNRHQFAEDGIHPDNGHYLISTGPEQLHIVVAGGSGKHSAWLPTFGATAACSQSVTRR